MGNGPPANHRRLWAGSYQRHGLFFLMTFVAVYLFYSTEIMSNWNAERWMKNQMTPLDSIYMSQGQHGTSGMRSTSGSAAGSNRKLNTAAVTSAPAPIASANAALASNATRASANAASASNVTRASANASSASNATRASANPASASNATRASANASSASNAPRASAKAASASIAPRASAKAASASNATRASANAASASNATRVSTNAATASSNPTTASTNATTASDATAGFSPDTSSPVVPETDIEPTAPLQETMEATLRPTPAPYVSPGPYLVEYPYEYRFIINEPQRCEREKPFLVLVVPVAPSNKAQRDVIRATWGSESLVNGKAVKLFFLLGLPAGGDLQRQQQQLLQESDKHGDVIQSDFIDCYKNLTIKTMVMLEWLDSYCPGAAYAMKIDSDMFLNVANLVNTLVHAPKTNYMTGLVARNAAVLRDPASKWYLPHDVHPPSQYPRYALGLGYVLSSDLAKKLMEASRHVKPLYIEDVFLGLCMQYLGVPPTEPPSWNSFHVFPLAYSRCAFSRIIATTTTQVTDLVWLWRDFKKPGPYC